MSTGCPSPTSRVSSRAVTTRQKRCCNALGGRFAGPTRKCVPMLDPLDALRLPTQRVDPRPTFVEGVLGRVARGVGGPPLVSQRSPTLATSGRADDALDAALEQIAGAAPEFDP